MSSGSPHVHSDPHAFTSLKPPVSAEESIKLFTFMEAADESQRQELN